MKVYYWSPHTSYVATIKAVYNSAFSLTKYNKEKFIVKIINANGEWDRFINKGISLVNLNKKSSFKTYPRVGYFFSRVTYIYVFLKCFFPLKKLLRTEKPDYLLIHLITLLPIILVLLFKFETKFILRISGYPKLNFFRKLRGKNYWSLAKFLKYKVKNAVKYIGEYEKTLANYAKKKNFDGIICGHIHHAESLDFSGIHYLNCGDWVENCTAIGEKYDGTFEIIYWDKLRENYLNNIDFDHLETLKKAS